MRRQKRIKNIIKIKLSSFLEDFRKFIWKTTVAIFTALIFLVVVVISAKAILYRSEYFKVRAVESSQVAVDELSKLYKDKNIFKIDLKDIERTLQSANPDAKEVRVRIVLPDKLVVSLKFRKPYALIKNLRYYPVDEEGVILSSAKALLAEELPIIIGVDIRYDETIGTKRASQKLKTALELLNAIKKKRFIARYGVSTIDAHDIKSLSFYLKNGLEVKIGCENFMKRLGLLEKTLKDPRLLIDRIKYIDVRFDDAVVSPK